MARNLGEIEIVWDFGRKGRVSVKGVSQFVGSLAEFGEEFLEKGKQALAAELEEILKATIPITPMDTGALRASGRVFKPRFNKRQKLVKFDVVFGGVVRKGKLVNYAAEVHENPKGVVFKKGEEKFLEKTWDRMAPGIERRIAARVK